MRLLLLATRQSWREIRSVELYTLFFALLIAAASSSTITHFAERLHLAMELRASEFLGADMVVSGSLDSSPDMLRQGQALGLQAARTIEFTSMLASQHTMVLASVKAVDNAYPLRGQLSSSHTLQGEEVQGDRPAPGELWLDAQLFSHLGITPGSMVEVGATELLASRVLVYEPDRVGSVSFMPRALINIADLPATEVIQPGSRINYKRLWNGDSQALQAYQDYITPRLAPQQKIERLQDGNQRLSDALQRARQYLNLASLAAILLASVSIALSANNFASKRFDHAALLRCFGLSRRHTLMLFFLQLLLIGLFAGILGVLLGSVAQQVLFALLADLLPKDIPPAGLQASLAALFTALISLLGFGLPPLITLGRMPPLRVLRRDLQPPPLGAWLIYSLAISTLALLMWRLTLDAKLTVIVLGGGLLFAAILGVAVFISLRQLAKQLVQRNLAWRLGLGHLLQKPMLAIGQTLAFALIIFAMALIVLLRTELLDNWQEQLPEQAANHFAFNIMPHEKDVFADKLRQLSPNVADFYPMTPGRLTHVNNEPVLQRLKPDSRALSTVQRDLNLTWSADLPQDNRITAGAWWNKQAIDATIAISVEQDLAEELSLQLGDKIRFNIGGQDINTHVTSVRSVDWGSMQPNFFVIFAPDSLSQTAYTWMTSFYLAPGQDSQLRYLNQEFPAISLLRIEVLLNQLRSILAQVTLAVEFILLFVLGAGITVLLAGVQSTLASRIHQGALLRALGSKKQLLRKVNRYEFSTLGLTSGILAWLGCELTSYLLYQHIFKMPWQPHPWLLLLPLLGTLLINAAGSLGTRRVLHSHPMEILRDAS